MTQRESLQVLALKRRIFRGLPYKLIELTDDLSVRYMEISLVFDLRFRERVIGDEVWESFYNELDELERNTIDIVVEKNKFI